MPIPLSAFILKEDVICRMGTVAKTQVTQVVIPSSLVGTVLKLLHDTLQAGHLAIYYWPTMRLDIEKHIAQCLSCAETKGATETASFLEYPLPARPFDVVDIDILQLPLSIQGPIYVLVFVDHFSRFTVLAPILNKSVTTVAHAIVSHPICPYTTSRVLLSDNGTEFKNQALRDICTQFHIQQTFIKSYLPASNGLVERTIRNILEILRLFAGHLQETWKDWLSHLLPLLTALSFLPQTKRITTFCMDLRNAYLTMCLCPLLFTSTLQMIILNCSFTTSKLSITLFGRNLRLHEKRCFGDNTLRLPQFIVISVTLSRKEHLTVPVN